MSAPGVPRPHALHAHAARAVEVAAIERELARLWREPVAPGAGGEEAIVTRAAMSNLVVCAREMDAGGVAAELDAVVASHPSRVLVLAIGAGGGGAEVEALVSARCNVSGSRRQVCSEHVTLRSREGAERRLPSVVRPLLVPDLPTTLWWAMPSAPPDGGELARELADLSRHVVFDSLGWRDPVREMVATIDWAEGEWAERVVSDLAWRRLKPWRRLVSQTLDPAVAPGALEGIAEVEVEHGPHGLTHAWYLIGWLGAYLGWRPESARRSDGTRLTWGFSSPAGGLEARVTRLAEGAAEIASLRVAWRAAGGGGEARFERTAAGDSLHIRRGDEPAAGRPYPAPVEPRPLLLARELPDLGRDRIFRQTLALTRAMAASIGR